MRAHPRLLVLPLLALTAGLLLSTLPQEALAQTAGTNPDQVLPVDSDLRIGTLPNGVRYYVRRNTEPQNRAELRLAVDAGSALEDPDQGGVAHFLEHMLFNGTRRFEKMELVNFLERIGMRFGAHVNAYTSLDETVYMLTIPTDSTEIVERSFDILEDWASAATLSGEEIDRERGVIVEEWRARRENVQGRIIEQRYPFLLGDSRYAASLFAGRPDVIRSLSHESLRRYYADWYRPDLMAVVVVGDVDVDRYEALIREHFSGLQNPASERPRPELSVPETVGNRYLVVSDPEYPYTTVEVTYIRDAERNSTIGDYRENLVSGLFRSMLNDRLDELAREAGAPFLGASANSFNLVRAATMSGLFAQVDEDSILTGLEALVTEAARVKQHGFTESELDRQKSEVLRAYEKAYTERENTNSAAYAEEYVNNFLEDEPIPGIEYEYRLIQQLLPQVTVAEVNRLADELLAERNRAVLVTMPEKEGLEQPTEAELAAVFERVANKQITPYEDTVTDQPLVANPPDPAAVTARAEVKALGVTEITLANGVRVVMKPTDFKEDEVRFQAQSPGGSSLVPAELVLNAQLAPAIVMESGVGPFSATDLEKLLAGKVVSVQPGIGELEEGMSGAASPRDLETLFQLIHLYFTAPRADSSALVTLQNQYRAFLENRSANPNAAFQDSIQSALFGDHPRRQVPTLEDVAALNLRDAARIYQERFGDAGDFTFVFVGNFDVDTLTALAQQYLGTLPSTNRRENWRDVYPDLPTGVVAKEARKGVAPQSQVALIFNGPFEFDRENRHVLRTMVDVLNIQLREELREERGGVYGVGVQPLTIDEPEETYRININFTTDPNRVNEMIDAVFSEIEQLRQDGPSEDHLGRVREQQRRDRETAVRTNPFWLGTLDFYYGQDEEDLLDVNRYDELIQSTTPEEVQAAARQYLDPERYVRVVLYPEATAAQ